MTGLVTGSDVTEPIELIDVDTLTKRIESQAAILQDIRDLLRSTYERRTILVVSGRNAVTATVTRTTKLFVDWIVCSIAAPQDVTIKVGENPYTVRLTAKLTRVDLPIFVDRGSTITVSTNPATDFDIYFIGSVA
jgi:hypothetical protein